MTRLRALAPLAAVLAVQAAILVPAALRRLVDPDEGWYGFGAIRALRVKTYALTALLLIAALAALDRARPRRLLLGGLLFGLAVSSRLLAAAALPALALVALRRGPRGAASFAAGTLLGLAPALFFLARGPRDFVFDNLGYHAERSSGGLVGDLPQKARTVENLFGLGSTDAPAGLQFLALVVLAVACAALARRLPLPLAVAGLVGAASIVPTPSYVQYFAVTVPFLVLAILETLPRVRERVPRIPRLALVAVAAAALWALAAAVDLRRYDQSRAGPGADVPAVRAVARAVDAEA